LTLHNFTDIFDNSGARLYFTSQLRPIESAYLVLGKINYDTNIQKNKYGFFLGTHVSSQSMIIPPGQKAFTLFGYCPMQCTLSMPAAGVEAYAGILHTHLIG
jgi:hypothetical protein